MITIDGSEGEGGGQVLRNACALSLVTGQPFRDRRTFAAGREKPGLMRQHLTAIEAACAIGGAECEGLAIGARPRIVFRPGRGPRGRLPLRGRHRRHDQPGAADGAACRSLLAGGALAPGARGRHPQSGRRRRSSSSTASSCRSSNRMGPSVSARLVRHGFYPARRRPDRGRDRARRAARAARAASSAARLPPGRGQALVAALPGEIALRELVGGRARTARLGRGCALAIARAARRAGPGQCAAARGGVRAGDRDRHRLRPPRRVGRGSRRQSGEAHGGLSRLDRVGRPLSRRPAAAAAGAGRRRRFTTVRPSLHARTAAAVISRFLDIAIRFEERAGDCHLVRLG